MPGPVELDEEPVIAASWVIRTQGDYFPISSQTDTELVVMFTLLKPVISIQKITHFIFSQNKKTK